MMELIIISGYLYAYVGSYSVGTTIYGVNNEVCDAW